jgi:hypothetical protein
MNSPNAMIMEHVRPYLYGWYTDFVDPLPPIEHGWLHAPQNPGIGTRLRPEVFERPDVELRVSDESIMISGMNDEGWAGGANFSNEMWTEMEEIMDFRSQGSPISERLTTGVGDSPTGGPGGGIANCYQDDDSSEDSGDEQ